MLHVPSLKAPSTFGKKVHDKFFPPNGELPGAAFGWPHTPMLRAVSGELSVWSGYNGHGKSLLLNQTVIQMAASAGEHTVIASMEMPAHATLYRAVRQATGGAKLTPQEIESCLRWLDTFMTIYDFTGTAKVDNMLAEFKRAKVEIGATQFVVDSLTKCGIAEDDYAAQKALCERFHDFAMKEDVHVHLVAHAKKPPNSDEVHPPKKYDILGASGISNIANNVYIVWRNKEKEVEVEENGGIVPSDLEAEADAMLVCDKSREYGSDAEKRYKMFFHKGSLQYLVDHRDQPTRFFKVVGAPY